MYYLALSCLQGRPMARSFDELASLLPDGIQLTPGNQPTPEFEAKVAASGVPVRTHHGFSWSARRRAVWDGPRCLVEADSIHPISRGEPGWLARVDAGVPALETMYPGHPLGCGAELEVAMDRGRRLAVDVSHVFIQFTAGVLAERTWRRLQDYDRIAEVHVSDNDGTADRHRPITRRTFGLAWAKARSATGTPVVLEGYFHRLSERERQRQLDLLRG